VSESWVPDACTLPTVEQPVRRAEFDDLFTGPLRAQHRLSPSRLRWELDPAAAATARELTARETECCSFFTFTVADTGDLVRVDVEVPDPYVSVLDALAARAAAALAR
jgi:hypothetical protein